MIPLNYIYEHQEVGGAVVGGGGIDLDPIKNFHRKECAQLLDNYGMIVGYTCVEEKTRLYEAPIGHDDDDDAENHSTPVIPDDLYESLIESANAIPIKYSSHVAAPAPAKKTTKRKKSPSVSEKGKSNKKRTTKKKNA